MKAIARALGKIRYVKESYVKDHYVKERYVKASDNDEEVCHSIGCGTPTPPSTKLIIGLSSPRYC